MNLYLYLVLWLISPIPRLVNGLAHTVYSGKQQMQCLSQGDTVFLLRDTERKIVTLRGDRYFNTEYTSNSPSWCYQGDDRFALDVHYGVGQCYLFYKTLFNRNSVDGRGKVITSYVNYPEQDAYWDHNKGALVFGKRRSDGAGLVTLDIVAHEYTHGMLQYTTGLIQKGDPGAIAESICDIMAKSIQFWSNPADTSWVIGSGMHFPIRNMSQPPACAASDADIYQKSSIGNYMFYLLVRGKEGLVAPIRLLAADSIIYETAVSYLRPGSSYVEWRTACIAAADKLFGPQSPESKSIAAAWSAAGISNP